MRGKCRFSAGALGCASLFCASLLSSGETPAEIGTRLKVAAARDSLANADAKPWHMKLDVTLFDDEGKSPQAGTIEVWRSGDKRRIVYEFGKVRYTRLELAGTFYRPVETIDLPYRATQVLETALAMGPSVSEIDASTPELRKQTFRKVTANCIMLSQTAAVSRTRTFLLPLGVFPTYCLDPATDNILLSYNFGGEVVNFRSLGKFLDHEVPTKFEIIEGKVVVASAALSALSTYVPTPDEFMPTADIKTGGYYARISSGIIRGLKIGGPVPVYPESAKEAHLSGSVVLHAVIGKDGHIHRLQPMGSPDPEMTLSALLAVRKWTYKPYVLNGEPTDVDTTITVNFNMGPN